MKGTLTRSSELREQAVPEAAFPFGLSSNIHSGILLLLKSPLTLVFLYLYPVTNLVQEWDVYYARSFKDGLG